MVKRALVTGITGQDGSYLAELLLSKGYEVHGIIRRSSTFNTQRIDHIYEDPHEPDTRLFLHYGDLTSAEQLANIIYNMRPDEVYNLGAQSHVQVSYDMPEYTGDVTGLGAIRVLEAIRRSGLNIRFYQASSSELFGDAPAPQNESTEFRPRSPYAAAKAYSYWMTRMYREGYGLFCCNGILFNHESPRRGETFVTRKVTRGIANIIAGKQQKLYLGNLDSKRDWGYAPEYVEAMWLMLQQESPDDFVIGTGESHSVKEFVAEAFAYVDLDWRQYIEIDERYFRPLDVIDLRADNSKARAQLLWEPKTSFKELVMLMVDADMASVGLESPGEGRNAIEARFDGWHRWENIALEPHGVVEGRATEQ